MAITLTERATQELKRYKQDNKMDEAHFFRLGVAGGGCSGFSYSLTFDTSFDEAKDSKYNFFGLEVVVDKKSLLFLDGTIMDWHEGIDRRGFTFNNPNAAKTCGCGSSFQA